MSNRYKRISQIIIQDILGKTSNNDYVKETAVE